MKLIPFSTQYLRLGEPLPFGLRDADGRLLLGAGLKLHDKAQLEELVSQSIFADEAESANWMRRLNAAVDLAIRQGTTLMAISAARPEAETHNRPAPVAAVPLHDQWHELVDHLDAALREVRSGSEWRSRLFSVHVRARQLFQRRPDASLYHLVYEAGHSTARYSGNHALLSLLIAEHAASMLNWSPAWIDSLGRAALTMNIAMRTLQDQLATSRQKPSAAMSAEIDAHAAAGAAQLEAAGLGDPLCVAVVRLHHDASGDDQPLAEQSPERQLARLLRRVDIFTAKISCRATRSPMSPVQAAREACLGPHGVPDEIGGALLKAVGLYPPGSFVELANGEVGIVVARGRRANLPHVAALVSGRGEPLGEPLLRDTLDRRYAVKAAVAGSSVNVRPPHERLHAMH